MPSRRARSASVVLPGDERGAGVRHRLGGRADRDDRLAPEHVDDVADARRVGAPVEVGFDPDQHHEVARAPSPRTTSKLFSGQRIDAHLALVDLDLGPLLGEVVERVGVDLADRDRRVGSARSRRARPSPHPATSNRPASAITITGERSGPRSSISSVRTSSTSRRHQCVSWPAPRPRRRCSAVSASTSAGSIAGNIPTRSWLRPSLR